MTQPGAFNGVVFFVHDMIEDRAQAWVQNSKFSELINIFYTTNRKFRSSLSSLLTRLTNSVVNFVT